MARNVEIKARVDDLEEVERRVTPLADGPPVHLAQHDVFFAVPAGRLKLRVQDGGPAELIRYSRPDEPGPKGSSYDIFRTPEPGRLRRVLEAALGERGSVRKERTLYRIGRTRVHLDRVSGLGSFVELEVVLEEDEREEEGAATALALMSSLGIPRESLVSGAYLDLILAGGGPGRRRP